MEQAQQRFAPGVALILLLDLGQVSHSQKSSCGRCMITGFNRNPLPNIPAAGKAAIAPLFAVGHHCSGLPEPVR